jgi:regulator of nucleoside diphosphate kinase
MIRRRGIVITEDDMVRLKELVRHGRVTSRRDQGHLEDLERELEYAEVVPAEEVTPDVVTLHSTVRVLDVDTGATMVYTVVFPAEADLAANRISVLAPIGTALIGYRVGDVIDWRTPGRTRRLRIEAVLFQPEASAVEDTVLVPADRAG